MMLEGGDAGGVGSGEPAIPIWVAILVGLITSLIQSLGLTIQRKSHVQNDEKPPAERKKAVRRPLWLIGFAIFLSSNLFGTIFQIGALPIVILAPLGAVSLLWNAILSRLLLQEQFPLSTTLGTALIATGCVLIAVFGVVPEGTHSLEELLVLFGRPGFVGYFVGMGVVVVGVLAVSHIVEWRIRKHESTGTIALPTSPSLNSSHPRPIPNSPSPSEAGSTLTTNRNRNSIPFRISRGERRWSAPATPPTIPGLIPAPTLGDGHVVMNADEGKDGVVNVSLGPDGFSTPKSHRRAHFADLAVDLEAASAAAQATTDDKAKSTSQSRQLTLLGLSFAACSGTLSGMSLLLAKCAIELLFLSLSKGGHNQFKNFQSWILLLGLGAAALSQLFYLNHSLRLAGPALICPFAFCFYNITSIFGMFAVLVRSIVGRGLMPFAYPSDGLVFYSQFAVLLPYQIALVSVGIALLLVGVWLVSAVNPTTGEAGIEVRDWADESVCSGDEEERFLEGPYREEPLVVDSPMCPHPSSVASSPVIASPTSPRTPTSPWSAGRRSISMGTRFGTLIPELAPPPGVPVGFSIGFNTSSPGFALRHAPHGEDEAEVGIEGVPGRRGRRSRTRSEGRIDLKPSGIEVPAASSGILLSQSDEIVTPMVTGGEAGQPAGLEAPRTWGQWLMGKRPALTGKIRI